MRFNTLSDWLDCEGHFTLVDYWLCTLMGYYIKCGARPPVRTLSSRQQELSSLSPSTAYHQMHVVLLLKVCIETLSLFTLMVDVI